MGEVMRVNHIPPGSWVEVDPAKFQQIMTKPIMKHEKTFTAINKLKDIELELHRLKNALEMVNKTLDTMYRERAASIDLVLKGTKKPVQTKTLEALQRDRLRIAKLIAGKDKFLRQLIDSYTMASKEQT
jgi:hypothetical protein